MPFYRIAWIVQGLVFLCIPIVGALLYLHRHPERADRARFLRMTGMIFMGGFDFLFAAFLIGETLSDPGGRRGAALVASWLLPVIAMTAVAWFRPRWGVPLLAVLTTGAVALMVGAALDPRVRDLEDSVGPIAVIVLFAVAIPVTALGRSRTRAAGIMLLVLGIVPNAFELVAGWGSDRGPRVAALVISLPLILTGLLYLGSAWFGDERPERSTARRDSPAVRAARDGPGAPTRSAHPPRP